MGDRGLPDPADGNGARPSRDADVRGVGVDQRELVDFGDLGLSSRLDAAQRVATAGARERERIGRDLHDGAQQRLTALRIRLALAAEEFESRGDADASAALSDFGEEVDQAIDELRAFVQGVYPVLLTSGGLSRALAAAGKRESRPVTVLASGIGRYSAEIETSVYFCCLAALDNAAKHAGPSQVTVRVWDQDELCFSIRDTGHGFDPQQANAGAGITNMRDRIVAVGGSLTIDSTSRGTVVEGSVPHAA